MTDMAKTSISPMLSVRNGGEGGRVPQGGVSTPCGENRPAWGPRRLELANCSALRTTVEQWLPSYRWGNLNSGSRMSLHAIRRKPRRMGTPLSGAQEFQPRVAGCTSEALTSFLNHAILIVSSKTAL